MGGGGEGSLGHWTLQSIDFASSLFGELLWVGGGKGLGDTGVVGWLLPNKNTRLAPRPKGGGGFWDWTNQWCVESVAMWKNGSPSGKLDGTFECPQPNVYFLWDFQTFSYATHGMIS